jgi:hypothetical protein
MVAVRDAAERSSVNGRHDAVAAAVLALLGIGIRLAFVEAFPAQALSDSIKLIAFGRVFRDQGLLPSTNYWTDFNPGLPIILSVLYRFFPDGSAVVARTATTVVAGLVGLIPFLLWRRVLPFGWRLCAGLLLALWPGQVFFSGIVVQDNWVLLPGIALCALAVRVLRDQTNVGQPVAAGLLFGAAVAIRQEMILALLPPLLAAGVPRAHSRLRSSSLVRMSLAAGIPILLLASQRYAATGRFTIATEHGGMAFLGTFAPGSFKDGWTNPRDFIASIEPTLFADPIRLRTASYRLAWEEAKRHPGFHTVRIAAMVPYLALVADAENLYRAISWRGGLPEGLQPRAERFRRTWDPLLKVELAVIQGLFLATLMLGVWRRDSAILVIAAAVALKVLVHVLMSPMSRLVLPAIAFELLAIPLGGAALGEVSPRRRKILAVVAGGVPILLLTLVPSVQRAIEAVQLSEPRVSQFSLEIPGRGSVTCTLDAGALLCLNPGEARLETRSDPGDAARAVCTLPPLDPGEPLTLRLRDNYSPGGLPGRMIARVFVDGRQILRYDLAAKPGSGWLEIPLVAPDRPPPSTVTVEEVAINPDPGLAWGPACPLDFAFRR